VHLDVGYHDFLLFAGHGMLFQCSVVE